jgi:hypothetical protein
VDVTCITVKVPQQEEKEDAHQRNDKQEIEKGRWLFYRVERI